MKQIDAPEVYASLTGQGVPRRKGELFGSTTEAVRQLVVTGVLGPGQRVRERELCEQLNVSRTPVREAIKALIQEGLLEALPNRSAVVPGLHAAEVQSLAVVITTLEGLAAELACAEASPDDIAAIGDTHASMIERHGRGDLTGYFQYNKTFHRRFVVATGNPVLLWTWDQLSTRVDRARYASNLEPKRWTQAIAEHAAIVDALRSRNTGLTSKLMREHIENGLRAVIRRLQTQA